MSSVLEASRFLKDHGIDAVNVFDGARARVRINPITASHMIMQETGMECITHMACRDRNMVGLQSDLIGAYSLGVKNILAVTGDPTTIGDYPFATSVYDVDSIGLCRALNHMNQGRDLLGNALGRATQFTIACAVNPCADDMATELNRLHKKSKKEQPLHLRNQSSTWIHYCLFSMQLRISIYLSCSGLSRSGVRDMQISCIMKCQA